MSNFAGYDRYTAADGLGIAAGLLLGEDVGWENSGASFVLAGRYRSIDRLIVELR